MCPAVLGRCAPPPDWLEYKEPPLWTARSSARCLDQNTLFEKGCYAGSRRSAAAQNICGGGLLRYAAAVASISNIKPGTASRVTPSNDIGGAH